MGIKRLEKQSFYELKMGKISAICNKMHLQIVEQL